LRSRVEPRLFITVTLAGIAVATAFHLFLDPALRLIMPEDYPANLNQWLALALFSLAFNQLFFIFAPFAWLMRLFQNQRVATVLTVLFGAFVLTSNAAPPQPRFHPRCLPRSWPSESAWDFCRLVLSARRGALELVVDAARRSEKFVGCGG